MKITILQDFLRSGGTERQSILLANAFAAAGHGTSLITFRPGGALASTVAPAVARHTLQPFDLHLDWFAPRILRTVAATSPDVVVAMGRMVNCYAGTLQESLPRAAVVATMRTGKKLPYLYRGSLTAVRHIVANSRDARDTLTRDYRVPPANISVIYNSLVFPSSSSATTSSSRDALRAQHRATPATTVLLCVAMFRPEKNQRELIEIVSGLPPTPDWQLWLAGDGPARAACEQLAAEKNLSARVRFLGFHRDPAPLYAAADVAVHASTSEALSNFLIEAQAHGLPAIACAAQGIDECFLPGRTGWTIPRGDHRAFRAALASLLVEPPAARTALSTAAREFARTTFDPARNAQAYLDLFSRLIASPAAPPSTAPLPSAVPRPPVV